jgi:thiol-disulfide isomerase/thioredoxin
MLRRYRQAVAGHVLGYDVQRIDTFPDGGVWNRRGQVVMRRRPAGSELPADFWAQRPDLGMTYYYNGAAGYDLDDKTRTYQLVAKPFAPSVLGSAAGQLLAEELLAAADSTYQSVEYYPTSQGEVLHFQYPDQPAADVLNRHTYLVLDAQTGLPREVIAKVVRGGGKWTIIKRLSQMRLDAPADVAVLNQPGFLAAYREAAPAPVAKTPSLRGQRASTWALASLAGAPVRLASYKGRVVVLDFWETHCAPCIQAMPELQQLQTRYGGQGVVVLGMLADASPGAPGRARGILKRQGATYVNVLADKKTAAAYQVAAFPRQLVIGRTGRIEFDHEGGGAGPALAAAVQKALKATGPPKARK